MKTVLIRSLVRRSLVRRSFCLGLLAAIAPLTYHSMATEPPATETSQPFMSVVERAEKKAMRFGLSPSVQRSVQQSSSSQSSGTAQQTRLNLRSANLSQPYILSVSTSGNQISGQIVLDGKVIQTLTGDASFAQASQRQSINLSPNLTIGQHTVEISARYSPASSTVQVEFSGMGTHVSQQSSGTGVLNHLLVIQVD